MQKLSKPSASGLTASAAVGRSGASILTPSAARHIAVNMALRFGVSASKTLRLSVKTIYSRSFTCNMSSTAGRTSRVRLKRKVSIKMLPTM